MVLVIYQIILHLNKITECLKMTTFKIVFTFDVFLSAETTMHCKVTCILYKKQAHFSQLFCLQVRSVTTWQLHDRKSRCLRGRRHSSILYVICLFCFLGFAKRMFYPALFTPLYFIILVVAISFWWCTKKIKIKMNNPI
jgi:hypothetical protein